MPKSKRLPVKTVRDFRAHFQDITEPTEVLRSRSSPHGKVEILGTWIPNTDRTGVRYAEKTHPERSGEGK